VDDFARGLPCVVFDPQSMPAERRARVPERIGNVAQPIIRGQRRQGLQWMDCPHHHAPLLVNRLPRRTPKRLTNDLQSSAFGADFIATARRIAAAKHLASKWVVRGEFFLRYQMDERFQGWGGEDTELLGRIPRIRLSGPLFHLWHAPADRSNLRRNRRLLGRIRRQRRRRARSVVPRFTLHAELPMQQHPDVAPALRSLIAVYLDAEPREGITTSRYLHSFVVTSNAIRRIPRPPDSVLYPVTIRPAFAEPD
jgi:hypothetical protein